MADTEKIEDIAVGKDILSYCGKCKLPSAHIILNMKSEASIGKCECKTCNAKHNYRNPEEVAKKQRLKASKAKVSVAQVWKEAVEKAGENTKTYSMTGKFEEGDVIDHPKFGKGVVEKLVDGYKIQTIFEKDSKLLISAR